MPLPTKVGGIEYACAAAETATATSIILINPPLDISSIQDRRGRGSQAGWRTQPRRPSGTRDDGRIRASRESLHHWLPRAATPDQLSRHDFAPHFRIGVIPSLGDTEPPTVIRQMCPARLLARFRVEPDSFLKPEVRFPRASDRARRLVVLIEGDQLGSLARDLVAGAQVARERLKIAARRHRSHHQS